MLRGPLGVYGQEDGLVISAIFFSLRGRPIHLIYPLLGSVDAYDMGAVREVVDVLFTMSYIGGKVAPVSTLPLAPVPK